MEESLVTFYAEHQKLFGNLHLPYQNAPCVITLHGLESSKDSGKWPNIAARLNDEGYACLRFNFRGCGSGPEKSEGAFEDVRLTGRIRDYKAAVQFLEDTGKVDMRRMGVIGSSFGGMVAIAAQVTRVKAMVCLATPYELSLRGSRFNKRFYDDLRNYDLLQAVRNAPPLLILHGSADELVPPAHAQKLYEAARKPKRLAIIEGADHVFSQSEHLNTVIELSFEWFKRYLV